VAFSSALQWRSRFMSFFPVMTSKSKPAIVRKLPLSALAGSFSDNATIKKRAYFALSRSGPCQVGVAGVHLAHALSFGLQVFARDLQLSHELVDIRDGRRSGSQDVFPSSEACSAASADLRSCMSARSPSTILVVAVSETCDNSDFASSIFATSIALSVRSSGVHAILPCRGKGNVKPCDQRPSCSRKTRPDGSRPISLSCPI
jgi:hypothetical protein